MASSNSGFPNSGVNSTNNAPSTSNNNNTSYANMASNNMNTNTNASATQTSNSTSNRPINFRENRLSTLSISSNSSSNSSINMVDETQIQESPPNSLSLDLVEDDVPLGTPREERLVSKLKVIDVVSQNSNDDEDTEVGPGLTLNAPVNVSNLIPLNSPTLPGLSSDAVAHRAVAEDVAHLQSVRPRTSAESVPSTSGRHMSAPTTTVYTYPQHSVQHSSSSNASRQDLSRHDTTRLRHGGGGLQGRITLLVGGTRFVVNSQTFINHPNTMLGRMFR